MFSPIHFYLIFASKWQDSYIYQLRQDYCLMENLSISKILSQDQYKNLFEEIEVPAKSTLLKEGEIAKKIFFIQKGCARLWFNKQGKDITFQFFFEGEAVSSIESFRLNLPSKFSLQCLEPCSILTMKKSDFLKALDQSSESRKMMEEILYQRLLEYQNLFFSHITESPQERYEALLHNYPNILKRIPQHYIASYLGITSVSLSRIRNRR